MKKKTYLIIGLSLFLVFGLGAIMLDASGKEKKPVRVYADVSGDLLHAGHIEFFKKAKALGDVLIIGVLSDETITSYKRKPVQTMDERVRAVEACKYVDEVLPNCPLGVTEEWIKEHKIDLVVHGDDFDENTVHEQYPAALKRGIFRSVPYTKGISTTNLINRIKTRDDLEKNEHTASR